MRRARNTAVGHCCSLLSQEWCIYLLLFSLCVGRCGATYDVCTDDETGAYLACEPGMFDIIWFQAFHLAVAPENATCGTPPSTYRRLGDRTGTAQVCDASSASLQHPSAFIVDSNSSTWWQSVSQPATSNDLRINITLSFNKSFIMAGDIIITFNSGRPEQMVLEKSVDYGVTWSPLQFYARNCTDFKGQVVEGAAVTADTPTAVICTNRSVEVVTRPPAGQKVTFPVDERFLLFLGPNEINFEGFYTALDTKMLDFLQFTDLRLKLMQPATDRRGNFDMYYYGIADIQLTAWCDCNLHAAYCNYTDTEVICDCQHNTMGKDCEACLPLYNDRPWKPGSHVPYDTGTANECIKCECNDHAESCIYNTTYGWGICQTCLHNTRGYHCELCELTYYPNMSLPLNDINRCVECDCDLLGVYNNSLVCAQENSSTETIGQCLCRPLISGRRCDQCVPGYYGLKDGPTPGNCTACTCNLDGTVGQSNTCQQTGGQCPCKQNIEGRECDTCADSYFLFPTGNPQRDCLACECDKGGSVDTVCDKSSGQCSCRENITGEKCDHIITGTFVPMIDTLTFEPLPGACDLTSDQYTPENPFDGAGFVVCNLSSENLTLSLEPIKGAMPQRDIQWPYIVAVRYSSISSSWVGRLSVQVMGDTEGDLSVRVGQNISTVCPVSAGTSHHVVLAFPPELSSASLSWVDNITLDIRCQYSMTLELYQSVESDTTLSARRKRAVLLDTASSIIIDSVLLLPGLSSVDGSVAFQFYTRSENQTATQESYLSCLQQVASLVSRQRALEQSACQELLFSLGAELHDGARACGCSADGTDPKLLLACHSLGGQCQCLPGVSGRTCDTCTPGYFNLTSSGCTACPALPCQTSDSQTTTTAPFLPSTTVASNSTETVNTTVAGNSTETDHTTVASNNTETDSTTAASNNTTISVGDKCLAGGFIALIIIAVVIVVFIIVITFLYWKRKKKRRPVNHDMHPIPQYQLNSPNHQTINKRSLQENHNTVLATTDLKIAKDGLMSSSRTESDSFVTSPAHGTSDENSRSLDHQRSNIRTFSISDDTPLSHSSPKQGQHFLHNPVPEKSFPFDKQVMEKLPRHNESAASFYEIPIVSPDLRQEKTRSRSLDVPSDCKKSMPSFSRIFDGHGIHQWSPVSDLQLSVTDRDTPKDDKSSSTERPSFIPDLEDQDNRRQFHMDERIKHEPLSAQKSRKKTKRSSPPKPQRQKQNTDEPSILHTILPPPAMYDSVYTSEPDDDSMSDRQLLHERNQSPTGYSNLMFLPDAGNLNFAGYNFFDEVNGSLV